ncbi:ATP-binding protein [Simkania negevensis]|uniref:ATPase n=1 Tax=Simkania negevensis (strain ATCC VR-1471 / DSM 27360 / Z) TaxID=331113 RepID=F8L6G5_SIMNZ|nr:AAA family ATPase [Simkania negevensis]CCB88299.1 hypothetical protein SNE_A04220 [Simkania negevensis Z]
MNKFLKRANAPQIHSSFERPRVTALLGARRVGKTTLLKSYMAKHPDKKWVFLNMDKRHERLRVEKEELEIMIEEQAMQQIGKGKKIWVAIDEAQKCPTLFDQVKTIYDDNKDQNSVKFILNGSGHLNLHQLAAESLAGRVELMYLREFNLKEAASLYHPEIYIPEESVFDIILKPFNEATLINAWEKKRPFQKILKETLSTCLIWGGLPEVLEEQNGQEKLRYLANYLQTYLENDVRAIQSIHDLELYEQLMKACAEQTGSLRDDQKLMNALHCARNTLTKYRGYLLATMQYREVFPYIASTVKRLVKSPKGYLINNGLVSYLTGIQDFALLNSTGLLGHRFENWILNELLTWTDSNLQSHGINYWRTSGGTEVDFILTVGDQVLPIEVTFSSQILPKKIRHLKEFMQKEPKAKWGICLYNGSFQIQKEEKIICIPAWMV